MPFHVSKDQFADCVERALQGLPEPFALHVQDKVRIEVRHAPTRTQLRKLGLKNDDLLFGLYEGVNELDRSIEHSGVMPEVIYIFQEDHELVADTEQHLVDEVRKTVLHEIGHHFGMDEEDLEELGYG